MSFSKNDLLYAQTESCGHQICNHERTALHWSFPRSTHYAWCIAGGGIGSTCRHCLSSDGGLRAGYVIVGAIFIFLGVPSFLHFIPVSYTTLHLVTGAVFFFAGVDGVKWKKPVVPGDMLVMEVEIKKWNKRFGIATATGRAYVDGEMAVELNEM